MSKDREIEFVPVALRAVDLEFVECRRFTVDEIARIFSADPVATTTAEDAA